MQTKGFGNGNSRATPWEWTYWSLPTMIHVFFLTNGGSIGQECHPMIHWEGHSIVWNSKRQQEQQSRLERNKMSKLSCKNACRNASNYFGGRAKGYFHQTSMDSNHLRSIRTVFLGLDRISALPEFLGFMRLPSGPNLPAKMATDITIVLERNQHLSLRIKVGPNKTGRMNLRIVSPTSHISNVSGMSHLPCHIPMVI